MLQFQLCRLGHLALALLLLAPEHLLPGTAQVFGRLPLNLLVAALKGPLHELVAVLLATRVHDARATVPPGLLRLPNLRAHRTASLGVSEIMSAAVFRIFDPALGGSSDVGKGICLPPVNGGEAEPPQDPQPGPRRIGRKPGLRGLVLGLLQCPLHACALLVGQHPRIPACRIRIRRRCQHGRDALARRGKGILDPLAALLTGDPLRGARQALRQPAEPVRVASCGCGEAFGLPPSAEAICRSRRS